MFALYYEKDFDKILIQKSDDKDYLERKAEHLRKGIYIGNEPCLCLCSLVSLMGVIGNYIVEPFKEQ